MGQGAVADTIRAMMQSHMEPSTGGGGACHLVPPASQGRSLVGGEKPRCPAAAFTCGETGCWDPRAYERLQKDESAGRKGREHGKTAQKTWPAVARGGRSEPKPWGFNIRLCRAGTEGGSGAKWFSDALQHTGAGKVQQKPQSPLLFQKECPQCPSRRCPPSPSYGKSPDVCRRMNG